MYSEGIATISAGMAGLSLGIGLGLYFGKQIGMRLGINAREFAESFGVGNNAMQAGVNMPQGPFTSGPNPYGGALGKSISAVGGGGGGFGGASALGAKPNWQDLYQNAVATGMSPAAAQQLLVNEMQRYKQQQQQVAYANALGQQAAKLNP